MKVKSKNTNNDEKFFMFFHGTKLNIEFGQYHNRNFAIRLVERDTGEPYMTATVNMVDEELEDDEVIIKDYSENVGILYELITSGYVERPHRYVGVGKVRCGVCRLTEKSINYMYKLKYLRS